ncbi:hypothetical protein I307_02014 [Cryptococcus deuterogattii 99/473]|uniref:Uncharacterized protein n=1 Tax=Cryptococcus deuterogattii Ram5 TaxID=1296110 RepID=A0A0D0V1T8_9TREE|nr:hypothetical protein I309_04435 [Cryptococcus deuterogattii LA55]KIR35130.1 hypothetical protein I352_02398 [Cryptococcus deuterogattii MMRL2647]KIR40459.1 hypothetical protein I313_03784 [Cryptococcus deuterogattii Ram5]KIR72171.1 hypothetical protein I310_04224 [Cryptococcus deuterogattii CA1014]KIR93732.1 hypothetical protein I304_02407 [Cryptococcus deuterogattii CBS 10090]KIS00001.1 hypothetical protein L804_02637 [Cryptococcus deuterogattii 2001/935-1]KIY58700.1 hypothetical protein 
MRFTSMFVAALPFIGSVFAAPLVEKALTPTTSDLTKKDVDILSSAAGSIGPHSVEADVTACLNVVIDAFNWCGNELGIDLSVGVHAGVSLFGRGVVIARDTDKQQVAEALSNVIQTVNVNIIQPIPAYIAHKPSISKLLSQIDVSLTLILKGVDSLVAGVLILVNSLLKDVGIILTSLLGGLLSIL